MNTAGQTADLSNALKCNGCGAILHYEPNTRILKCTYCASENQIARIETTICSFDYYDFVKGGIPPENSREELIVQCGGCGASVSLPAGVTSDHCPFCASPLVINLAGLTQILKPHYVLPFIITSKEALGAFQGWMKKLWFAPSDLVKKVNNVSSNQLQGVYIPHWSYDTDTETTYTGSRGDYYYTTETYTREVDGETVTETREVRHTRWTSVYGRVYCRFDDLLVSASPSLPQKIATTLEPWKMEFLQPFDERFLGGFRCETYRVDAEEAFETAKQQMEPAIKNAILRDIGGDEQSISSHQNTYQNVGFKYLVLPVWLSAYRYKEKLYHFVVNACTGEVAGERPYSAIKIILTILLSIGAIVGIYYLLTNNTH